MVRQFNTNSQHAAPTERVQKAKGLRISQDQSGVSGGKEKLPEIKDVKPADGKFISLNVT